MQPTKFINNEGLIEYRLDGKLHREDGPAYYDMGTNECWFYNNKLHRVGGPAESWSGSERWYRHGELHREDGPAVTYHDPNRAHYGDQEYWQYDKLHRLDGPAIITGTGIKCWWVNNHQMFNDEDFQQASGISDEDMVSMILKYGHVGFLE